MIPLVSYRPLLPQQFSAPLLHDEFTCRPCLTNGLRLSWWCTCLNQTDFLILLLLSHSCCIFWMAQKLTHPEDRDPNYYYWSMLWVSPSILSSYYDSQYDTMMNNTCTIKCGSIMTSKLVRLPENILGYSTFHADSLMGPRLISAVPRQDIEMNYAPSALLTGKALPFISLLGPPPWCPCQCRWCKKIPC
jgi:hypothetical protein